MEGPTPVSSLIHSSTLVVIGCLLLDKVTIAALPLEAMLLLNLLCLAGVLLNGYWTYGPVTYKRCVALSTSSQVCLTLVLAGSECTLLSTEWLLLHGSFKAAIFMLAGTLAHRYDGPSHLRLWTWQATLLRYSALWMAWSSLTSTGAAISAGLVKERCYELFGLSGDLPIEVASLVLVVSMGLTMQYMLLLLLLPQHG